MPHFDPNDEASRRRYYAERDTRYKAVVYDPDTGATYDEAEYGSLSEAVGFAKLRDWDAVIDQVTDKTVWSRLDRD